MAEERRTLRVNVARPPAFFGGFFGNGLKHKQEAASRFSSVRAAFLVALVLVFLGGSLSPGLSEVEFQVNTVSQGDQSAPAIAGAPDGSYVVVWQGSQSGGTGSDIYAQRYTAEGLREGSEFRVNTQTGGDQVEPSVAMRTSGDFVVAWHSSVPDEGIIGGVQLDEFTNEVFVRHFRSDGPQAEFKVADTQAGHYWDITLPPGKPKVAMDPEGGFVVAWETHEIWPYRAFDCYVGGLLNCHPLDRFPSVHFRRYTGVSSPTGLPESSVGPVVDDPDSRCHCASHPSVAAGPDGSFVIVWEDWGGGNARGQRYDPAGVPLGAEFRVNDQTDGPQHSPSIAMDPKGNFAVAFVGAGGIYAKRYEGGGNLPFHSEGSEFRVDQNAEVAQGAPAVAVDSDGDFFVVWERDGSGSGIYGRRYNKDGSSRGPEFRINTYTDGAPGLPAVAMDAGGRSVAVWQSSGQDGEGNGIIGRRFATSVPPQTPQDLTATPGDGAVNLSWAPPSDDGDARITQYRIYRSTTSNGPAASPAALVEYAACSGDAGRLCYTDPGLQNGTTYFYRVSAVNGAGEGPKSVEASAAPAPLLPVLSISDTSVIENSGRPASFTLKLSKASEEPVLVRYALVEGTARFINPNGQSPDFLRYNGQVTIPAGIEAVTFGAKVFDDAVSGEGDEVFYAQLLAPVNAILGTANRGTATIKDNEP